MINALEIDVLDMVSPPYIYTHSRVYGQYLLYDNQGHKHTEKRIGKRPNLGSKNIEQEEVFFTARKMYPSSIRFLYLYGAQRQ